MAPKVSDVLSLNVHDALLKGGERNYVCCSQQSDKRKKD